MLDNYIKLAFNELLIFSDDVIVNNFLVVDFNNHSLVQFYHRNLAYDYHLCFNFVLYNFEK